jgi:hypothetical protein
VKSALKDERFIFWREGEMTPAIQKKSEKSNRISIWSFGAAYGKYIESF